MNVFQRQLDILGSQIIEANERGDQTRCLELMASAEVLAAYEAKLFSSYPVAKVTKTQAVQKTKAPKGRSTYEESEVIKLVNPFHVAFNYAAYSKDAIRPKVRCEFKNLGHVKSKRNGSSEMLLALQSINSVEDLEAGKIYAFKPASLRDLELIA